jgi:hypothetical protein
MLLDQFSKTQSLVQFARQGQTAVGSDEEPLEIDLARGIERELKRLVPSLIHWVLTSGASSSPPHSHEYSRKRRSEDSQVQFKMEM